MDRIARMVNPKANQKQKKKQVPRVHYKFEWEEAVHHVAEFYKLTWEDVGKWNILKFFHRCEYANFDLKKKQEASKASKYKTRQWTYGSQL